MAEEFQDFSIERKVLKSFFDENIEKATKNFEYVLHSGLDYKAFTGGFRDQLFRIISDYHKEYSTTPSIATVVTKYKRLNKKKEDFHSTITNFEKVLNIEYLEHDRSFLISELRRLYWLRELKTLHVNGVSYLNQVKLRSTDEQPDIKIKFLIDELTKMLSSKTNQVREGDVFKDITVLEEIQNKRDNPIETKGIDTGIPILTIVTNGWNAGELILISGRPGQGKSVLLSNFGYKAFIDGKNVVYFSLEMPFRQQQYRFFAQAFGIQYAKIKTPHHMNNDEFVVLKKSLKEKSKKDNFLFVVDAPEKCTTQFIDNKITEIENKYGITVHLCVVDPIYLMRSVSNERREKDDPVGMISGELKLLAMKRSIPFLAATQINRAGGERHRMGKDPDAMDLSFSDRLAHNADMIFIITSDPKDLAQLHIVKFRDGSGPKIYLKKMFEYMKFEYSEEYNDKEELKKYTKHIHADIEL